MADNQSMEDALGQPGPAAAPKAKFIWLGVLVGIILISAVAGFSIGKAIHSAPAEPKEEVEAPKHETKPAGGYDEMSYYDFDAIVVTLNEPRMDRFVRVAITLEIKTSDFKGGGLEMLDKRKPEVKNWLTGYLMGCTLEQVRGDKNFNRLRRELQDSLNKQLWGYARPMIDNVLFREFAVQ